MKIKYECKGCKTEWTSQYGLTVWYYKVTSDKKQVQFKVQVYGQDCKRCKTSGKLEPYECEWERLAENFVAYIRHIELGGPKPKKEKP